MEPNWPKRWGFLGDLRECVGKTIERVELLPMPYGSVSDNCFLIRFTDGARAYILGRPTKGIAIGPKGDAMGSSLIVTPEEFGQLQAEKLRDAQARATELRREKERQLKRLQEELQAG